MNKIRMTQEGFIRLTKKTLVTMLMALIIFTSSGLYLLFFLPKSASAAWFDENWAYRQTVALTNSGSNQTDYQISFTLDTATLITASKVQSDCDDLRITDINGKLLPHWIETGTNACNTATTAVWTKVPSITTSGATIYVYYGNPSAPSVANGKKVFEFFDDFGDGLISSSWTQHAGGGSITETGGVLRLSCTTPATCDWWSTTTESGTYVYTPRPSSGDYTFEARISSFDNPNSSQAGLTEVTNDNDASFWGPYDDGFVDQISLEGVNADSGVSYGTTGLNIANSANTGKLTARVSRDSSTRYLFNDVADTETPTYATWANESNIGLMLKDWASADSSTVDFDYFYIRKYAATEPSAGTPASEEQAPGPVAYWKFDDGQGSTTQDSTSSNLDGSITGATWTTEDQCISGKCLKFDGSNDLITVNNAYTNTISGKNNFTVEMWVKINAFTPSQQVLWSRNGGSDVFAFVDSTGYLSMNVGAADIVTATGLITTNKWYHVAFVKTNSTTAKIYINGNDVKTEAVGDTTAGSSEALILGEYWASDRGTFMFNGFMDDAKVYNYTRTAAQILQDYNSGLANAGTKQGTSAVLGTQTEKWLSDGLMGYWKMDEASGNATDSSGNSVTLTNNATTTFTTGKFGNAATVNGTTQYLNTATTISGIKTVSFWAYTPDTTNYFINLINSSAYITSTTGTFSATGFTSPSIYVNGVLNGTIAANTWTHVAITTDTGINVNAFAAGLTNDGSNHFLTNTSKLDDVRIYNRAFSSKEVSDLYSWAPGPVGYWNLEEGSGTAANDTSGNSNNGTLANSPNTPVWKTGKFGKGLSFDGSSTGDYVTVSDSNSLHLTSFTLGAWIYGKETGRVQRIINGGSAWYDFRILSNNQYQLEVWNGSTWSSCAAGTFTANTWHYVTATHDGAANSSQWYIDGIKTGSACSITASPRNAAIYIGGNQNNEGFNGIIDEVKIYNYTRTPKQIVADMNAGHPAVGSPVGSSLGYWKFDEGQGTTANNSGNGGSALNGTLTNSPAWTNSGKFGKALTYTAASSTYVDMGSNSALAVGTNGQYTLSAWAKTSGTGTQPFFSRTTSNKGYLLGLSSGLLVATAGDGNTLGSATSTNTYNDGSWHHFVATYDGTSATVKLYVDGVYVPQTLDTTPPSTLADSATSLLVGRHVSSYLTGTIDEEKIYNYALTADEVKTEYNRGSSLILGSLSDNSSYQVNAANQEYCIPGDTTSCAAPVARWDFEEGSGNTVYDKSGNGFNATWGGTGSHWKPGKVGRAGNFSTSATDYTQIAYNATLKPTSAITISYWVKFNSITDASARAVLSTTEGGGYSFQKQTNGDLAWRIHNGTDYQNSIIPAANFAANTWYHVTGTYTSGSQIVYLNGRAIDTDTPTGSISYASSNPLCIGAEANPTDCAGGQNLDGLVDQLRIYNYVRTPAQVAWDYNRGKPVGWWKFDDCQGTTAGDSSGNGNNGTITIGASGEDTVGTCTTSSTAWGGSAGTGAGKRNYALSLDGTDDYVNVGTNSSLAVTSSFTVMGWMYYTSAAADKIIFGSTSTGEGRRIALRSNAFTIAPNGAGFTEAVGGNVSANAWHHLAGVYNGANIYFYVDGIQKASNSVTGNLDSTVSTNYIGALGAAWYLGGQIDDVRLYNYALTPTQLKEAMNDGAVRFGPVSGAP